MAKNRICFIRTDGIGDFIVWYDTLIGFMELYPEMKLCVICDKNINELVQKLDIFDDVYSVDFNSIYSLNYFRRRKLKNDLKKCSCEICINVMSFRGIAKNMIAAFTPAMKKIAIQGRNGRWAVKIHDRMIYDEIYKVKEADAPEIERNASFLRALGNTNFKSGFSLLPMFKSQYDISSIPYFVCQVGASTQFRCLSARKMAQIINVVSDRYKLKCCLIGKDEKLCREIIKNLSHTHYINLINKTMLTDVMNVIQSAKFFIGPDSFGSHIAMGYRVPTVVTMGGWHWGMFFPYLSENPELNEKQYLVFNRLDCYECRNNYSKKCKQCINKKGTYLCIDMISVDAILKNIDDIMLSAKS